MNQECTQILKTFGFYNHSDLFVVSANFDQNQENDEIKGVVK